MFLSEVAAEPSKTDLKGINNPLLCQRLPIRKVQISRMTALQHILIMELLQ